MRCLRGGPLTDEWFQSNLAAWARLGLREPPLDYFDYIEASLAATTERARMSASLATDGETVQLVPRSTPQPSNLDTHTGH